MSISHSCDVRRMPFKSVSPPRRLWLAEDAARELPNLPPEDALHGMSSEKYQWHQLHRATSSEPKPRPGTDATGFVR